MKNITLSSEARARIARQIAENAGVVVAIGDQRVAPSSHDLARFQG